MQKNKVEIERKFLVTSLPAGFKKLKGSGILQGYLVQDPMREVRVRLKDGRCYLTVKEGPGLNRREVELAISRAQFDELWPLTEGRRLEKTRYVYPSEGVDIEIDIYRGKLQPLRIAEVEFPNVGSSEEFKPPAFFGREITGKPDYYNASLAIHGVPHRTPHEYRIGALPYIIRNGKVHVVLVTNSSGTRWIVPKGQPEPDMTRQDVAVMEAVEEAGVIGILEHGIKSQCKLRDGRTLHLYPVKVSTLLKKWPESTVRKRELLPLKEAVSRITDKALAKCVERLAARLK